MGCIASLSCNNYYTYSRFVCYVHYYKCRQERPPAHAQVSHILCCMRFGNRLRTAIERMLGFTNRQCAVSLLSGFLLAALLAVAIGCAAAVFAEGRITELLSESELLFDTTFTIGPLGQDASAIESSVNAKLYSALTGLGLFAAAAVISAAFTFSNIKKEPLKLLGSRGE